MAGPTKRIDGKVYEFYGAYPSKLIAVRDAEALRKKGRYARVIRQVITYKPDGSKYGYVVWVRPRVKK